MAQESESCAVELTVAGRLWGGSSSRERGRGPGDGAHSVKAILGTRVFQSRSNKAPATSRIKIRYYKFAY